MKMRCNAQVAMENYRKVAQLEHQAPLRWLSVKQEIKARCRVKAVQKRKAYTRAGVFRNGGGCVEHVVCIIQTAALGGLGDLVVDGKRTPKKRRQATPMFL